MHSNLVFFSFDYGYCLVKYKANKLLNNKEVWLIETFLDDNSKINELFITEKQFKEMLCNNIMVMDYKGNFKGYKVPLFNAKLM